MHQIQPAPLYTVFFTVIMAESRVELFIETLTGTAFELSCSPLETIKSIKDKIHCLEGIPVSQQHLIWRSEELLNDCCLEDYSITDGATLKLVLGMKGGPVNTSQAGDSKGLGDIADFVQTNCATAESTGRPFTVLVFQDGDEVHMYRLLKTEDCSISPSRTISDTSSLATGKNLGENAIENNELLKENELTREKMAKIQERIKALSLNKPKRKGNASLPISATFDGKGPKTKSLLRNEKFSQNLCLPPVHTLSLSDNHFEKSRETREGLNLNVKEQHGDSNDPKHSSFFPPTVESEPSFLSKSGQHKKNVNKSIQSNYPPLSKDKNSSVFKLKDENDSNVSELQHCSITSHVLTPFKKGQDTSDNSVLSRISMASKCEVSDSQKNIFHNCSSSQKLETSTKENSFHNFPCPNTDSVALSANTCSIVKYDAEKIRTESKCMAVSSNEALSAQRFLSLDKWVDNRPKTMPHLNLYKSLDRIIEGGTFISDRSIHEKQANKKERKSSEKKFSINLPSAKIANPLSQPLSYKQNTYWNFANFTCQDKADNLHDFPKAQTCTSLASTVSVMSLHKSIDHSEEISKQQMHLTNKIGKKSDKSGRKLNSAQKLPPIKMKKRCYKRCSWCNKKTGLATSYTCRCSKNFCAAHRYAELHNCSYDYKSEGRRLLELNNPVVVAPKLPKI